ncbi:TonB-dependent receptor [Sphingobacterium cellulitidis]|uniref:TonB-dependent receptor n=1 Tax=Sphingobacterium cellulitidis TaxID=1768011 RepID=UPI00211AE217|nr:TonB-dependent receptor [Sphingobacterium cellulitidis]
MNFYEIMRAMKITMVLLTCLLVQVSASTYAQRVTLEKRNSSIYVVLEEIRKQTNYSFLYNTEIFEDAKSVSVNVKSATLDQALKACFNGLPYNYVIKDGYVTVTRSSASNLPLNKPNQQQLQITGRVVSSSDGRALSGVSVRIKGMNTGTSTDANGAFSITVPAGGATLIFTFLGLEAQEVRVGPNNTNITLRMKQATATLEEVAVTVQARRRTNTEAAVLEERKKAAIVQDAISAQQIERTASITTTQALQRVTGVTVTDDKYVAVRGLGDRSVIGQLNGVRLASSDPDKSSIPLDLVPASLLDNITVYKTVTPDKPADAASGIVELKTKSVPDKMTFELIAQTGLNSNIGMGGQYNSFWNSGMGLLGTKINEKNLTSDFLNLSSQYPKGLGDIHHLIANSGYNPQTRQEVERINGIMQGFDPVMTTGHKRAPLNQLYSATFGNSYKLFKDKHTLGLILGGNYYRRTTDIYDGDLTQYSIYQGVVTGNPDIYSYRHIPNYITPNSLYMGRYQTYKENTGVETLNYGVLAGLTYRFNPRHEISAQYVGSWGGESTATNMNGAYEYTGLAGDVFSTIYSLKQTFRDLHTYNLQGEHKFLRSQYSPRLSYNVSMSQSSQNDPDFRYASLIDYVPVGGTYYQKPVIGPPGGANTEWTYTERLYALSSGYVNGFGAYGTIQAEPNGRRWRNLDEDSYNHKADLTIPFPFLGEKQELKTGVNYLYRERKFTENILFLPGSNFNDGGRHTLLDVEGNLDRMVSNEVIGIKTPTGSTGEGEIPVGGFLYNSKKSPNNYKGFYETRAAYAMLDLQLPSDIRLTGGVRVEKTNIQTRVDTKDVYVDPKLATVDEDGNILVTPFGDANSVYKTKYVPYYSANLTYTFKENMNFRMAYNSTLARPELREITNVFEFDPYQMGLIVGNPDLVNQKTQNLDFRWEWFPGAGEVFAISAFGKQIDNQLVKVFSLKTEGLAATYPEFPIVQFQNDKNTGRVWGLELEAVKDLSKFWGQEEMLFFGSNLLIAQSEIKKSEERLAANRFIDRHAPLNSPLFEQAPYSINAWLNYNNKKFGTDLTATFNMVGERLIQINLTGEPDLYTQPAPTLDFVFSQKITPRLVFKGYAKNILNPAIKTVYANPSTGGKWYGNEYINRSYKRGSEIMLGLTYNLF